MLNKALGISLRTGVGETTNMISMVHIDQEMKLAYFDCPGLNELITVTAP